LLVRPSKPRTSSGNFRKEQASDAIVEKVNPRPVNIPVVLIRSTSNQVEIPSHQHWELGAANGLFKLGKEGTGAAMVSRAIDPHKLEEKARCFDTHLCRQQKGSFERHPHLKHTIPKAHKNTSRVTRRWKPRPKEFIANL
jgi:hypothetical protein